MPSSRTEQCGAARSRLSGPVGSHGRGVVAGSALSGLVGASRRHQEAATLLVRDDGVVDTDDGAGALRYFLPA